MKITYAELSVGQLRAMARQLGIFQNRLAEVCQQAEEQGIKHINCRYARGVQDGMRWMDGFITGAQGEVYKTVVDDIYSDMDNGRDDPRPAAPKKKRGRPKKKD